MSPLVPSRKVTTSIFQVNSGLGPRSGTIGRLKPSPRPAQKAFDAQTRGTSVAISGAPCSASCGNVVAGVAGGRACSLVWLSESGDFGAFLCSTRRVVFFDCELSFQQRVIKQ